MSPKKGEKKEAETPEGEETKVETPKKKATRKQATPKTEKKTTAKSGKKVAAKKTTKQTKGEKKTMKKGTKKTTKSTIVKKAKKEAKSATFSKTESFVAEAIFSIATEENAWVSDKKIVQYGIDYLDTKAPAFIPSRMRRAIDSLVEKKLLRMKKRSFAFTSEGQRKIAPTKVQKRKKIDRPVKVVEEEKPEPIPEARVSLSGRTVRPVIYA